MKNLISLLLICSTWSCRAYEQKPIDFKIQIIEAIVVDTVSSPVIAFICKFTNSTTVDLCFGNKYYQEMNSGSSLVLFDSSLHSAPVLLGSILDSKYFVVRKGESRHLVFSISPLYVDSTILSFYTLARKYYDSEEGNDWPFQIVENSTFKYISRIDQKSYVRESYNSNEIILVDSTIQINMNKFPIKYVKNLSSEEAG